MTSKEFIQIGNYIIKVSEIVFIKKTRIKGEYCIHVELENGNIKFHYEDYTQRDEDFKRILKELTVVRTDKKENKKDDK